MLTNSKILLLEAKKKGFAIPATNFIDLDSARTFVNTAQERGLPLILPFAQSHESIISLDEAAVIGKLLAKRVSVPIVLHLDHGEDMDFIFKAIELGFTSVMIDASQESFEANIEKTEKVVEYAHKYNVSVEAELGHVGANDTSESETLTKSVYTEVDDVVEFVSRTNVDSLAISIGTAHGVYKGSPKLNFQRLREIALVVDIPLVLHGGSSTGDANLKKCAISGISKINIYTDFINGAFDEIKENVPGGYIELKQLANRGMYKVLNHYFDVFQTQPVKL
ncbi:class II fructose-bisphosphate aldolase [Alkalibacter rhizosphaerae]|uniref:Class II fructose-bisphosphate aldolase n=1 Tax=Alkalibacter rhizosphaerae TaxID=2815577 RepID=A0A974XGX7_9FIRM|nr:class II fructose-bisphosphate aldolase [Alkalibacter rhizosphaerae]QSX08435.1 class II fructose-bisphosphate aldolase [Alkalibacter rhizosphaerae]